MVKLIFFFILGSIIGFGFILNIMNATGVGMDTIKQFFGNTGAFYELVSQLFIIATHPLFRIFLGFSIVILGVRIIFSLSR